MYGRKYVHCKDTIDGLFAIECENCYEVFFSTNCYGCFFISNCENCSESMFLYDCKGCHNCFMCSNLRNKTYYINNQPHSKEEYNNFIKKNWTGSYGEHQKLRKKFAEISNNAIRKSDTNVNCENCSGNDLINCKNCQTSFEDKDAIDCKYYFDSMGAESSDCMDCDNATGAGYCYELLSCYLSNHSLFGVVNYNSHDLIYSIDCYNNSHDLFGCVGMKNSEFCILNKQYTKKEYEKLASEVICKMQKDGEWGEFYPMKMSPYCYNECTVNEFFPKTKKEVLSIGGKWRDEDIFQKYEAESYTPKDNISAYKNDEAERQKLLKGVVRCEVSGRAFQIMPAELAFYIKNNIPIPRKHYAVRHSERWAMKNPRKLCHRKCMNEGCSNKFETTYAPDRTEKVYCESCYQKAVI